MRKKERKLTAAELKRKETFEKVSAHMEQEGYQRTDLTVGVVEANVRAILVMLPFMLLTGVLFYVLHRGQKTDWAALWDDAYLYCVVFLVTVPIHELIHGITWSRFAPDGFRAISFGVIWEALTPYCTCSQPLTRGQYITGSVMPTAVLGSGIAIAALCTGNPGLLLLAELELLGGGGDFLIIGKILHFHPDAKEVLYLDHPYECGLVAFMR